MLKITLRDRSFVLDFLARDHVQSQDFLEPTEHKSERRNKSGGTKEMGVVEAFRIKTHTLNYNQSVKKVYLYEV